MSRLSVKHALSIPIFVIFSFICVGQLDASSLADITAKGKLTVISYPHQDNPFVSVNLEAGAMPKVGTVDNFIGADIDIMATFAELLGVELEIRPITIPSYGELIPSLLRGEGDIVASSFSITDARLKLVEFSDPYFEARMAVVVLKGSKVKTFEDLSDKRAALTPGSSQEELMLARGFSSEQIRHTDFMRDSFLAVVEGDSDFTVVDAQLAERVSSEFKDAKIAFYMPGDSGYGFAVPKGSDLLKSLNLLIAKLKESGELKRIFDSYDIAR